MDPAQPIRQVLGGENGEYALVPDGADSDGLLRIIREARFVEPRELEPEMRGLEPQLTGR